jgi:hypothetical protein
MNEKTIDQIEKDVLSYEVADEAVEAAGTRTAIAGAWTFRAGSSRARPPALRPGSNGPGRPAIFSPRRMQHGFGVDETALTATPALPGRPSSNASQILASTSRTDAANKLAAPGRRDTPVIESACDGPQ